MGQDVKESFNTPNAPLAMTHSVRDLYALQALRYVFCGHHRLVGQEAPASRAEDPGVRFPLPLRGFSGSSHTSGLKFGTPVATLPGAWRCSVSAGTGRPGTGVYCDWVR